MSSLDSLLPGRALAAQEAGQPLPSSACPSTREIASTIVLYPAGVFQGEARVVNTLEDPRFPDTLFVMTDQTPFHPLSYSWPDQPGDQGHLTLDGQKVPIQNCLMAAWEAGTQTYYLHQAIPTKSKQLGEWRFFVGHAVAKQHLGKPLLLGQTVGMEVDAGYRRALSAGHSACHLLSLALNQVVHPFWKKSVGKDSLGHHQFDPAAIWKSSILPHGSCDIFRLGKSLRKQGFDESAFLHALSSGELAEQVHSQVAVWLGQGVTMQLEPAISNLETRRVWRCKIGSALEAAIPCGGTHLSDCNAVEGIQVSISQIEPPAGGQEGSYVAMRSKVVWKPGSALGSPSYGPASCAQAQQLIPSPTTKPTARPAPIPLPPPFAGKRPPPL